MSNMDADPVPPRDGHVVLRCRDCGWVPCGPDAHGTTDIRDLAQALLNHRRRLHPVSCPVSTCGGHLLPRKNAKTGVVFYGCSEWPKCRTTRPLPWIRAQELAAIGGMLADWIEEE